jgi:hypothetical protein
LIVIRFAEEQVIKFPEYCCDYIAKIIYDLTEKSNWISNNKSELPEVKIHTYEESLNLIQQNYRESYIQQKKTSPSLFYNSNKPELLTFASDFENEIGEIPRGYQDDLPF